ncbi:hypothetical protein HBI24_206810 [Parastagonospora nodorum]|nr:hypothetical protein HBH69_227030 [Parastagonospora nodorum]KAH5572584.1 hypothetical protein HBI24_206810 [Parastagonospora nodorum]KAH5982788.1 hypothetical protein HBI82_238140 [Parastagonospora nodorum]
MLRRRQNIFLRSEMSRREGQTQADAKGKIVATDRVGRLQHPHLRLVFIDSVGSPRDGSTLMLILTRTWAPSMPAPTPIGEATRNGACVFCICVWEGRAPHNDERISLRVAPLRSKKIIARAQRPYVKDCLS